MYVRQQQGFTLFELVVMMIIIVILAAIAVPKFINLTAEAEEAQCKSNQVILENAALMAREHNALDGISGYPAQLTGIQPFITSGFTTKCSDGATDLIYGSSNGSVNCPNHVR